MTVVAAWAIVAAIAVGLPAATWGLARNLKPPRLPLGRPLRTDSRIDHWLFERYRLGVLDRGKVYNAVLVKGLLPSDPVLIEPARGLATELLSARLPFPRLWWLGGIHLATGIVICAGGLVEYFVSHTRGSIAFVHIFEGAFFMVALAPAWLLIPKRMRRKAQQVQETSALSGEDSLT